MKPLSPVSIDTRHRRLNLMCAIGSAVGVLLIVAGVVWSLYGSGRVVYSSENAKEYEAASAALHAATSGHSHGDTKPTATSDEDRVAAVREARERFERAQDILNRARFAQNGLYIWIIGVGLVAAIAFGIGYCATARTE